jgi:hypothetical protein
VVLANNLSRAGKPCAVPLDITDFVCSVMMLAWTKENGCAWNEVICSAAAAGGHLHVLQWARENDCPWDEWACL